MFAFFDKALAIGKTFTMSLILRKSLYILLGSGGLYAGFLASIAILSIAKSSVHRMEIGDWLATSFFSASLVGLISGGITILAVPVYRFSNKVLLTVGMIFGYPAALLFLYAALKSASSVGVLAMWLYITLCPFIVSIMLIVEMWRTDTRQDTQARTR